MSNTKQNVVVQVRAAGTRAYVDAVGGVKADEGKAREALEKVSGNGRYPQGSTFRLVRRVSTTTYVDEPIKTTKSK